MWRDQVAEAEVTTERSIVVLVSQLLLPHEHRPRARGKSRHVTGRHGSLMDRLVVQRDSRPAVRSEWTVARVAAYQVEEPTGPRNIAHGGYMSRYIGWCRGH